MVHVLDSAAILAAVDAAEAVARTRDAFLRHAAGEWQMPPKLYVDAPPNGDFRAMPARGGGLAIVKWVTSFPGNPARGLPVVTGALLVSSDETGELLAILDTAAVTSLRIGAAAAVSAQALARSDANSVGIVGCGVNGSWAARCLAAVGYGPGVCADSRPEAAEALAAELGWRTGGTEEALAADVVVTVTPGDVPVVTAGLLVPGTHLAVLGADGHGKAEVEAAAIGRCRLFCDQWEQASTGGELAGPCERRQIGREDVTDLGAVLTMTAAGRRSDDEITLFDSTGLAIQDLGIAQAVVEGIEDGSIEAPGCESLTPELSRRVRLERYRDFSSICVLGRIMKSIRAIAIAVAVTVPAAAPAAAIAEKPSFEGTRDSVRPEFDWKVRDYVATCSDDSLTLKVDGQKGWSTKLHAADAVQGDFRFTSELEDGQSVDTTFKRKRDGMARHFHVRCLPADFPDWTFERKRPGGTKLFMVQLPHFYAAIFDRDGVPVWWQKADNGTTDAKVLPDGTISWNSVEGGATVTGAWDIRSLSGRLIRTIGDDGVTDVHDLQLLPNGNYVIGEQTFRAGVDTTAYGGSASAAVLEYDIDEVTPEGDVVRSWSPADHIGLDETGRWWPEIIDGFFYDILHWNAVEVDGRYMYLSFRHLDAIYKVDRRTGEIVWKLGGTETPESLEVRRDPRDYPIGGQHDVRVLPNGTVTIHNNRTDLDDAVPRAERFRIDEDAGTATLVDSIADPKVDKAPCCGSARRLPDKSWLVSWGQNWNVGAYDADGRVIYRLGILGSFSYRANPVTAVGTRDLRRGMDRMNR